jgi:hypothetical protein
VDKNISCGAVTEKRDGQSDPPIAKHRRPRLDVLVRWRRSIKICACCPTLKSSRCSLSLIAYPQWIF